MGILTSRRSFLAGIIASAMAPAIITTPGLIMPIKSLNMAVDFDALQRRLALYDALDEQYVREQNHFASIIIPLHLRPA